MTRPTQARTIAGACVAAVALAVTAAPAAAQESAFAFNANPFKPTNGAEEYECIYPNGGRGDRAVVLLQRDRQRVLLARRVLLAPRRGGGARVPEQG